MTSLQVIVVCILSALIGTLAGFIKGFEWWFPVTLVSMMVVGLIWWGLSK